MTKYNRVTGKVFGATASATGDNPEIGQFGSAKEGSYIGTSDISTIQALPAWGQGWAGAVTPETNFPPLPEMTGAMKVLSQQQCYLLQQGIPEWDNATIYYKNGFSSKNGKIYISQSDENQGNDPETDKVNWKEFSAGGGLELCDIGMALYVDETKGLRRYLNGQIVDINTNTQAFLNRLKEITTLHPSLLCTEDEWQAAKTLSAFGQVGKFVFNYSGDEIVSVRLPRVVNVQGLFDLQNLGMTVGAGLPNIEGGFSSFYGESPNASGALSINSVGVHKGGLSSSWSQGGLTFNASKFNPIYGNSDTVQQEAIQYPYFIQIATGSETEANIVNTLENVNGFTLLESKYSDKPLYNESWLLSNGQYNLKATYPTAYEGLQVEYNTEIEVGTTVTLPSGVSYTKRGLSVKLSTEEYTDYDFVLNTADETFRLPLKNHTADDGNSLLTLYYYVGDLDQNHGIVNMGRIGEQLAGKLDRSAVKAYITETYQNGTSWYRVWSDGWCEQGGIIAQDSKNSYLSPTITFMKPFLNTNYNIQMTNGGGVTSYTPLIQTKTVSSCSFSNVQNNGGNRANWYACGYIS